MKAIETITGPVSVLDRDDVDTDQIIPKQFLKRVERTGFGEYLFYDWAKEPDWDLPRQPDPRRRAELRLRLEPRARPLGAGGLRLPGDDRAELRRHLPLQLHQDRAAAGAAGPPTACAAIREAGEAQVDLAGQEVRWAGDGVQRARFEIDPEIKHRLLNGLDDIALTLEQGDAIAAYEGERERPGRSRARCERRHRRLLRPRRRSTRRCAGASSRDSTRFYGAVATCWACCAPRATGPRPGRRHRPAERRGARRSVPETRGSTCSTAQSRCCAEAGRAGSGAPSAPSTWPTWPTRCPSGPFDAVVSALAIHHLEHRPAAPALRPRPCGGWPPVGVRQRRAGRPPPDCRS